MNKRVLLPMILIMSLAQLAAATTTVTLTGSCPTSIINQSSNYLQFNISNSGNGAATELMLVPLLEGATTSNSVITIPLVAPGYNYSTKFYMYNFTEPGSYVDYIRASYSQGSSTFVTLFPCLANIMERSQSLLQITEMNRTGSRLSVSVVNLAGYPIDTNVTIQAPPTFGIQPASGMIPLRVAPNSHSTAVFNLSIPNYTGASFPVVAAVSYSNSSMHYATLKFETISFAASGSASSGTSIVTIGVVTVIIILIALILLSFAKKGPKQPHSPLPMAERILKTEGAQAVR